MFNDRPHTVSFSGHRSFKMNPAQGDLFIGPSSDTLAAKLDGVLIDLYERGYVNFICGMAEGFDLLAAQAVLRLRHDLRDVKLGCAVPFRGHAGRCSEVYDQVIAEADQVAVLAEYYSTDCFHRRNDYLLENSSVLVCYYNGTAGGTAYTVKKALKIPMQTINLF